MKGLVHIYTGDGKGKTTAALGLGMRAFGRGFKVLMVQFLKGAETGEMRTIELLGDGFALKRGTESNKFTWQMSPEEFMTVKTGQEELFSFALNEVRQNRWDMLILDEIMAALTEGMINISDVQKLISCKPEKLEVILTGRNAPETLIDLADYVSEIKEVKHPLHKGIPARIGIEG